MFYFFLFCLIASVFGSQPIQQSIHESGEDHWEPESLEASYLGLSSGASRVVPNIRTTFSCIGRRYGYFADIDNNCQIFHVCHPSVDADGSPVIYHFSKFCPKETIFSQQQLTCLPLTHTKLTPCSQALQYYPSTESRFAKTPVVVQQRENLQQIPETEIRQEQILIEEQRQETPAVKGIQNEVRNVQNLGIPTKNVVRNEPLPQLIPIEQKAEPLVQQPIQPVVPQTEPLVVVRNVEPIQQQTLPTEQAFPVENRANPVKQMVRNVETAPLKANPAVVNQGYRAPVVSLRNNQPIAQSFVSQPMATLPITSTNHQIYRPVFVNSEPTVRQTVAQTPQQTQYIGQPLVQYQPIQQYYPLIQPYLPLSQTAQVIRPAQYSTQLGRNTYQYQTLQQTIPLSALKYNYRAVVPQYLRTNPTVVRPAQNPVLAQV